MAIHSVEVKEQVITLTQESRSTDRNGAISWILAAFCVANQNSDVSYVSSSDGIRVIIDVP